MKKRMLATLLVAVLLLGAFAVSASAENTTVVQKWNIVLGDDIGANFYLQVPEATAASVKVTIAGQTQTHALSEKTSDGLYKVSARVAAARMTEDITLPSMIIWI